MNKSLDVAAYLVKLSNEIGEPLTNMKLQKLLYYAYAWYAVEKNAPLFEDKIFAWKYGPVVEPVYESYRVYGADVIKEIKGGDPEKLDSDTKLLIEDIFNVYGNKTAIELVNLTHSEGPWRDAFDPNELSTEIPFDVILKYYKAKKEAAESTP